MKEILVKRWRDYQIIKDNKVIKAFEVILREKFILPEFKKEAYYDGPLHIGYNQTISQPTTVLLMVEALELKKTDKVLEVGAGSGYGAAIMSRLAKKIYTTEIIPELVKFAKSNLKKSKIKNVKVIEWDGSQGYEKEKPYDRIIITAGCPEIPKVLIEQLKEGGIIIAPVGGSFGQRMIKGIKKKGKLKETYLGDFMFVPLRGKHGHWD